MSNLVCANLRPKSTAVTGTMTMTLKDGREMTVTDSFFSFVVTQRSPYSGVLTEDEMWVSYITLAAFPGVGR